MMRFLIIACSLLFLASLAYAQSPCIPTGTFSNNYEPVACAKHIVACLLRLADQIAPVITLAFFIIGGITYITSGESKKQHLMGKRYIIMGVVGIACIEAIVFIAAQAPFDIPLSLCS
jgi:hypothetical protein